MVQICNVLLINTFEIFMQLFSAPEQFVTRFLSFYYLFSVFWMLRNYTYSKSTIAVLRICSFQNPFIRVENIRYSCVKCLNFIYDKHMNSYTYEFRTQTYEFVFSFCPQTKVLIRCKHFIFLENVLWWNPPTYCLSGTNFFEFKSKQLLFAKKKHKHIQKGFLRRRSSRRWKEITRFPNTKTFWVFNSQPQRPIIKK